MKNNKRDRENDFVRRVMDQTAGSACEKACSHLPDLADRKLERLDRQLVQAHLEHCSDCRQVAVVLGWVQPLLPQMAVVDPGPSFTQSVLVRTTLAVHPLAHAARRGETVGPLGLIERMGQWWQKQLFRPRFALEVAYVATVILVLLTTVPGAPFRQEARQVQGIVEAGPMALPGVESVLDKVDAKVGAFFEIKSSDAGDFFQREKHQWQKRHKSSEPHFGEAKNHLLEAWALMKTGKLQLAGYQIKEMAGDSQTAWSAWWSIQPEQSKERSQS